MLPTRTMLELTVQGRAAALHRERGEHGMARVPRVLQRRRA
jgi:hypothetical protein